MGFNRRKMEDQRREAADKEAASRRATDAQVFEDAERLIAAWNERQEKRMPMLFSPFGCICTSGVPVWKLYKSSSLALASGLSGEIAWLMLLRLIYSGP